MKDVYPLLELLMAAVLCCSLLEGQGQLPTPPKAKKIPRITTVHGEKLVDDFYWLREKNNPEVIGYLKAENAYTDAMMKSTEAFQQSLYKEMLARIKETDEDVPYQKGDYFYYKRTEEGKQYPIYCRKKGSISAPEEITLNLNEMAKGHPFISLGAYNINNKGNLLAYTTDLPDFVSLSCMSRN